MNNIKVIGIIPARINSTRFPEKVIHNILGKPMIWHVYNQSKKAMLLDDIIVATDSYKVVDICNSFMIPVILTSDKHKTGTDRLIEVSNTIYADLYINIQGDEPLIKGEMIDQLIKLSIEDNLNSIATLKTRVTNEIDIMNPNIVKVITDDKGFAYDFVRKIQANSQISREICYYKHIGLYGYPRKMLLKISSITESKRELENNLEQLRFLDNNLPIKVIETTFNSIGVDIHDDIIRVENILINEQALI